MPKQTYTGQNIKNQSHNNINIMRTFKLSLLSICLLLVSCSQNPSNTEQISDKGTKWHWEQGTIVVDSPERPAGQEHVLGLTVPKLNVVRVGFVGLGMRGPGAVERFTHIPGVEIIAL